MTFANNFNKFMVLALGLTLLVRNLMLDQVTQLLQQPYPINGTIDGVANQQCTSQAHKKSLAAESIGFNFPIDFHCRMINT